MKTIHITSQDDLPDVAEAVIEALGRRIHHFDFYRINDVREAYDFGYEEYFYSGDLCLVEWPEKIEQLLPDNVMTVRITVDSDTARTFEID